MYRLGQYQEDVHMDLDTSMNPINISDHHAPPRKRRSRSRSLRKKSSSTTNTSFSPPPITPIYDSTKFVTSQQSPATYYANIPSSGQGQGQALGLEHDGDGQGLNGYDNNNNTDMAGAQQFTFQPYQSPQLPEQHQYYLQHYNTAPNSRHSSFSHQQEYYQDLPDVVVATDSSRAQRPKSLAAHDYGIDNGNGMTGAGAVAFSTGLGSKGGGGDIYPEFDTANSQRHSFLSAKPRQSAAPLVPPTWAEPQLSEQQQQYFQQHLQLRQQQAAQKKQLITRQSFHELQLQHQNQQQNQQQQQRRQTYSYEHQPFQFQDTYQQQQQQQYFNQQQFIAQQEQQHLHNRTSMDIAQYRTPIQGAASPHHRGQNIGLDIPMSPNPPITPSNTTSNSNGSPLTNITSPQSSGRSSSGQLPQKSIYALSSSPSVSNHYRKKSFNSGPLPLVIPTELSHLQSQAASPVISPYGSPSKVSSNYINMLAARKNSSSEMPSSQPRDLYRRSESYSTLQARAMMNHNNSSTDLNNGLLSSSQSSSRDHPMRPQGSFEQDQVLDAQQGTMGGGLVEPREDQYLVQTQHRDRSTREKHKRESFYAALQNAEQNSGVSSNNANVYGYQEASRKPSKGRSRAASPHLSNGISQASTKSRGSFTTTPTAEQRARQTPPLQSGSRTPGGNGGNGGEMSIQMQRQYTEEIQYNHRKSMPMVDEAMASFVQRSDAHHSSSSSTPSNQSGEHLPQSRMGDTVPVPVADITKHLSGLEFKEQGNMSQTDISSPGTYLRQPASGSASRRSTAFDNANSSDRPNRSGSKDRNSIAASMSQSSSRKRGKTLSSMDPPKAKPAPTMLPPMYMSTTSRTNIVASPMASKASGTKIPSPSGRKSTTTPRELASGSSSRLLSLNVPGGASTEVKTIRGGGGNSGAPETVSPRMSDSVLSNISNGTESTSTSSVMTSSNGMPKVKSSRSLSSGILGGLGRRRSTLTDQNNGSNALPVIDSILGMNAEPSTPKQANMLSKSLHIPSSARLPTTAPNSNPHSHHLSPAETKKTTTSGLRTPTAVKELRTSPSKVQHQQSKNSAGMISAPINFYASNQPTPLYGQGQAAPMTPKSGETTSQRATSSSSAVSPFPPMSPYAALKTYSSCLSMYERAEIGEYPQVYYLGQNCLDKKPASMDSSNSNFGFDDERGDYLIVNHDHLMFRYEILDMLGKGSFGQVAKCYDHKTGEYVAIKIIRNKKRFHCQALVEVKILSNLNKWDPEDKHNLIRMTDSFYFRNHLCIATELLSINLYEFIKSNSFQGFSLGLIKRFCTQLLNSLKLLNENNVVHCDLKPENVLLKHPTKSSIKVIDFGSSCLENEKVYTYIQSRFYRSPEVILGMAYNMAIDMWSLGCILAELYTGYPLFPGENEQEQLACIMEVQGVPEPYLIERSSRRKVFFDSNGNPKLVVNSKGKKRRPGSKTLGQMLKCTDILFLDFISKCLIWDPERRMKPHEGLMHDWILEGKGTAKTSFSTSTPGSSENGSGSRRKSSLYSSGSRKAKSEINVSYDSNGYSVHKSSRAPTNSSSTSINSNGMSGYYSGPVPIINGGSHTGNIAKIYGGQHHPHHQAQQPQQHDYASIYDTSVGSQSSAKKFTKDHEWVKVEDGVATVGITDHAQQALGEIVFVETAELKDIDTGDVIGSVESVKAASDVYAPLSGKVIEVNSALSDSPELINESPEADGWLCKIQIADVEQFDGLLNEKEYKAYVEQNN
ncbi:hypothetical protein BGZ79_010821 [Entomortierella chlamydospora]|nr:hypothetical protein BGZ79_010821 [Entomortierella chlamydospora]